MSCRSAGSHTLWRATARRTHASSSPALSTACRPRQDPFAGPGLYLPGHLQGPGVDAAFIHPLLSYYDLAVDGARHGEDAALLAAAPRMATVAQAVRTQLAQHDAAEAAKPGRPSTLDAEAWHLHDDASPPPRAADDAPPPPEPLVPLMTHHIFEDINTRWELEHMHARPLAQFLAEVAQGGSSLLREAGAVRHVPEWAEERHREARANATRAEACEADETPSAAVDRPSSTPWPETELLARSYRLARYMNELQRTQRL